jgi:glycosyltransferase involved in cell wall biosynthesis
MHRTSPTRITAQSWSEGTLPLVTVRCITYNHVGFIADAIESFLMQVTTFPVEILVHDDASSDGTAQVVQDYASRYPGLIKTILQTENQTSKGAVGKRFARQCMVEKTQGKYIALCDGDDYWSDPLKLEKQVDALEKDPTLALSFCNLKVLYDDSKRDTHDAYQEVSQPRADGRIAVFAHPSDRTSLADLMKGNYIHTPGVVFRNWIRDEGFPDYMADVTIGDWPLHLFTATKGDLHYSREVMGVYRVHSGGMWSRRSDFQKGMMALGQYPPLLRSDVFPAECKQYWLRKVRRQLARTFRSATTNAERVLLLWRIGVPVLRFAGRWWIYSTFRARAC